MSAKVCTKCGDEKPLQDFYCRKDKKDGRMNYCKSCSDLNRKTNAAANIERERKYRRLWDAENPYAKVNWRERNAEKVKGYYRKYHANNRDRRKPIRAAWFQQRKAELNPVRAQYQANRRARVRGAEGEHTLQEISALYERQRGLCACCSADLSSSFDRDHVVPLVSGGTNDIGNIQLLCGSCNRTKGARSNDWLKTYLKKGPQWQPM